MNFRGSHIVSISQLDLAAVRRVLSVAERMEPYAWGGKTTRVLEGAVLGNLFFEPSTRTRLSFGAAFNRLGGQVRETAGFQFSPMVKGESIYDTSRVVSGYVDVLVVRHPTEGSVAEFAAASQVPVINAGDGPGEHPTQALLDLYTVCRELRRPLDELAGITVTLVGDLKFGRTVHNDHPALAIFRQSDNGVAIRMALFALVLDVVDQVEQREGRVTWHRAKRSAPGAGWPIAPLDSVPEEAG
jgi:aspartate carbamoyltransferase catalytic subunit